MVELSEECSRACSAVKVELGMAKGNASGADAGEDSARSFDDSSSDRSGAGVTAIGGRAGPNGEAAGCWCDHELMLVVSVSSPLVLPRWLSASCGGGCTGSPDLLCWLLVSLMLLQEGANQPAKRSESATLGMNIWRAHRVSLGSRVRGTREVRTRREGASLGKEAEAPPERSGWKGRARPLDPPGWCMAAHGRMSLSPLQRAWPRSIERTHQARVLTSHHHHQQKSLRRHSTFFGAIRDRRLILPLCSRSARQPASQRASTCHEHMDGTHLGGGAARCQRALLFQRAIFSLADDLFSTSSRGSSTHRLASHRAQPCIVPP